MSPPSAIKTLCSIARPIAHRLGDTAGCVLEGAGCLLMAMDAPGAVRVLLEHGHLQHAMAVAAARLLATDRLLLATRVAFAGHLEQQGLNHDAAACYWAGVSSDSSTHAHQTSPLAAGNTIAFLTLGLNPVQLGSQC